MKTFRAAHVPFGQIVAGIQAGLSQPAGCVEISSGFIQQSNLGLNLDYNITSMNKKSNFTLGYFQGCGKAGLDWL